MKRFFTFLKTELKLSVRDMNMVIFAVIMPFMILSLSAQSTVQSLPVTVQTIRSWSSLSELSAQLQFARAD